LYEVDSQENNPRFGVLCQDQTFLDIKHALHQRWEMENIPWIAIGATIFDIQVQPTVNSKATTATAALLDIEF
jgi:hypothetical protein